MLVENLFAFVMVIMGVIIAIGGIRDADWALDRPSTRGMVKWFGRYKLRRAYIVGGIVMAIVALLVLLVP